MGKDIPEYRLRGYLICGVETTLRRRLQQIGKTAMLSHDRTDLEKSISDLFDLFDDRIKLEKSY